MALRISALIGFSVEPGGTLPADAAQNDAAHQIGAIHRYHACGKLPQAWPTTTAGLLLLVLDHGSHIGGKGRCTGWPLAPALADATRLRAQHTEAIGDRVGLPPDRNRAPNGPATAG
ncbi:hypothetical protein ACU4HD_48080 [Cupriavidus basilensis]